MKPIAALRVLATVMMVSLIAAMILPSGKNFLIGFALGLNVGLVVTVWNNRLKWQDEQESDRGELIDLQLREPQS